MRYFVVISGYTFLGVKVREKHLKNEVKINYRFFYCKKMEYFKKGRLLIL